MSREWAHPGGGKQALPVGDSNANPPGCTLFELLHEDLRTHDYDLFAGGFWALAVHRFGNWRMGFRSGVARAALTATYRVGHHAVVALFGIDLPYNGRVGRRVRFEHHGAVFIGAWSIGDDVVFRHAATVGIVRRGTLETPIIGNRVEIGPGACVVGGVRVGDDTYIGANTVLADDLPDGGVVLGNPARNVKLEELVNR